jgi:hypothetical protein
MANPIEFVYCSDRRRVGFGLKAWTKAFSTKSGGRSDLVERLRFSLLPAPLIKSAHWQSKRFPSSVKLVTPVTITYESRQLAKCLTSSDTLDTEPPSPSLCLSFGVLESSRALALRRGRHQAS